jgi:hypothetical protein
VNTPHDERCDWHKPNGTCSCGGGRDDGTEWARTADRDWAIGCVLILLAMMPLFVVVMWAWVSE